MKISQKLGRALSGLVSGLILTACGGGGSSGGASGFSLIEFLESGQDNIPRNRQVQFRFSESVREGQDLSTRLKIQNVVQVPDDSDFARAAGSYLVSGEIVVFTPRLPTRPDRADAGFRSDGSYVVFVSAGPDGLESATGNRVGAPEEFQFETNEFFEDVVPAEPPRAIQLVAVDSTLADTDPTRETNLSRLDPRPFNQAQIDNASLIANGRVIAPGAGGGPGFATPWQFDLKITEPIDPSTVTPETVQVFEVYSDATTSGADVPPAAPAGYFGNPINFRVAADVTTIQTVDDFGNLDIRIRVTPLQTLVDNTRYRIVLSGQILGLDFRKTFSGDNGLTGDGQTIVDGARHDETGGLGYVAEFLVSDHAPIRASRTLQYDPLSDGINPETGQSSNDENEFNSALYNPPANPGSAVGFLSAFGSGVDGPFAVTGTTPTVLNTGDIPNEPLGNPFTVTDLDPNDEYLVDTRPGGDLTFDSVEPMEMELESLTISSSSTLRVIGVNPVLFRVTGIVQITGVLDVSGAAGRDGGTQLADGGEAGAGGFDGADSNRGTVSCNNRANSCSNFDVYLNGCTQARNLFPFSKNGNGPGRGLAGGEAYQRGVVNGTSVGPTGTGGGGASHATAGTKGEDRLNVAGAAGTAGPSCSAFLNIRNSGVIGIRGMPGPTYGDREVADVTLGGSGGGAGGAMHGDSNAFQNNQSGGGGGGGGGSVSIVAAGSILALGGQIDASGGDGGKGGLTIVQANNSWFSVSGAGGGGSGGTISLVSGDQIDLTGASLTAEGGAGGLRANTGTAQSCTTCNRGGSGGDGFIFLMDADGEIDGFLPNRPGDYDEDTRGVLTIREFDASRFSNITAVTELFPMTAANPAYRNYDASQDIVGFVNANQTIRISVSSARGTAENPQIPDLGSELPAFEVARLEFQSGSTVVTPIDDMSKLNLDPNNPDREAFVRVQARFEYGVDVEAALGPFAAIDEVTINYEFN